MARKRSKRSSTAKSSASGPHRLQRLLASAGFGSRRQCEELIETGRVDVDGAIVTKLGTTVDSAVQKVRVDGVLLRKQKLVYYAVNKPTGVVTTNRDPQGRPRVIDLVPPSERVFPVGRLDRSSEGLILLTNDGELAQRLTHPKYGIRKVYRVIVAGKVDTETMRRMRKGIHIAEAFVQVEGAKLLKSRPKATEMEIVLKEGKNREIRRILARLGHKVQQLRRIAVGPLRLGDIPAGAYRALRREEVDKLWASVDAAESAAESDANKKKSTKKTSAKTSKKASARVAAKRSKKPSQNASGTRSNAEKVQRSKKRQPSSNPKIDTGFLPASGSRTIGAVIGGDSPIDETAGSERKQASKRSGSKKSASKRPAKKRTAKKRPAKKSTSRSKNASARSGSGAPSGKRSSGNRRGTGGAGRASKKNRKR